MNEFGVRFPSVIAFGLSGVVAWFIGYRMGGKSVAKWSTISFSLSPWAFLWAGRGLPEMWLVFGLLVSILGCLLANRSWHGAILFPIGFLIAFLTKQTGILALFSITMCNSRASLNRCLASMLWFVVVALAFAPENAMAIGDRFLNYPYEQRFTSYIVRDTLSHEPFNQALPVVAVAVILGSSFLAWFGFDWRNERITILVMASMLYALADTPEANHEYYALPAVAILAVGSGIWLSRNVRFAISLALATAMISVPATLMYSGDWGNDSTRQAALSLGNATISSAPDLAVILKWYNPDISFSSDASICVGYQPMGKIIDSFSSGPRLLFRPLVVYECLYEPSQ